MNLLTDALRERRDVLRRAALDRDLGWVMEMSGRRYSQARGMICRVLDREQLFRWDF